MPAIRHAHRRPVRAPSNSRGAPGPGHSSAVPRLSCPIMPRPYAYRLPYAWTGRGLPGSNGRPVRNLIRNSKYPRYASKAVRDSGVRQCCGDTPLLPETVAGRRVCRLSVIYFGLDNREFETDFESLLGDSYNIPRRFEAWNPYFRQFSYGLPQ